MTSIINIKVVPKHVLRNSKYVVSKSHPIKVICNSEEERNSILKNLHKLKEYEDYYDGVNITKDLPLNERTTIKMLSQQGKQMNTFEDTNFVWRISGNSKTGFYLKKMKSTKK